MPQRVPSTQITVSARSAVAADTIVTQSRTRFCTPSSARVELVLRRISKVTREQSGHPLSCDLRTRPNPYILHKFQCILANRAGNHKCPKSLIETRTHPVLLFNRTVIIQEVCKDADSTRFFPGRS